MGTNADGSLRMAIDLGRATAIATTENSIRAACPAGQTNYVFSFQLPASSIGKEVYVRGEETPFLVQASKGFFLDGAELSGVIGQVNGFKDNFVYGWACDERKAPVSVSIYVGGQYHPFWF